VLDPLADATEVQPLPSMFMPGSLLLDRYEVAGPLGMGGYGLVLRASDLHGDKEVAIKILRADVDLDHEAVERFVREARAVAQLRSEHVIRVFDVGTVEGGAPYLVMELLDGHDAGKLLARAGRLAAPYACELVLQACDALAEAHALGIIHRDIKPTNLFVTRRPDGRELVKLLDFGISKTPTLDGERSLTQTFAVLGTPVYMSPEQMRSARDVDARTDIWALGAVLYELVEGRLPFDAASFAELVLLVASAPLPAMTCPPELARVIERCLAKHPADRYPNVAQLAADLAALVATPIASARAARIQDVLVPTIRGTSHQRTKRRRLLAALGAGVALAALATVIALTRGDDAPVAVVLPPPPPPVIASPPPPPPPEPPVIVPEPKAEPAAPPVRPKKLPIKKPDPVPVQPKCDPYSTVKGC
jgi:serine/threonine protein kinase